MKCLYPLPIQVLEPWVCFCFVFFSFFNGFVDTFNILRILIFFPMEVVLIPLVYCYLILSFFVHNRFTILVVSAVLSLRFKL